ncbi:MULTISPECIES: hypothetical protein [Paenibacillaceae]|uniref:hypothetical protein n=1 Tax=Paenibacillaceae TaxID=186822 RepID=UPI00041DC92A|nr:MULTISPECIES: hypothetical protein [Paenibacillaceae]MBN2981119.1 hypothetical protein [Cohnella algarum]
MKETFIVKHAVGGKIFIDTGKRPVPYKLEEKADGGYRFTVTTPRGPEIEELLELARELNVFVFRDYSEENEPTIKTWFYVKDGPVAYDDGRQALTIDAESKIEYVPDRYLS